MVTALPPPMPSILDAPNQGQVQQHGGDYQECEDDDDQEGEGDDDREGEGDDDNEIDVELERMRKSLETARETKYKQAAVGKVMKMPAAGSVIKRPSASVIAERPSWETGLPAQPKLKSRFAAIHYRGCRIYWGGDRRYRVQTDPKKATSNFSWREVGDAASVWSELIAFCDDNALD